MDLILNSRRIIKTGLLVSVFLLVASFLLLFLSGCATRDTPNTANEINEECGFEMQAARTAVRLRDKGKTKTHLQAQLPPVDKNSLRLLKKMYEITDEVYEHTQLNETTYTTYRFELCQRELLRKPMPPSIQAVLPELLKCQQEYKMQSSVKSTKCILAGIETTTVKPPVSLPSVSMPGVSDVTNN